MMDNSLYDRCYYEQEASEVDLFGSVREICLSENIESRIKGPNLSILDVGCGDGYLLTKLQDKSYTKALFASDLSFSRIKKTRANARKGAFLQSSVTAMAFKDNSFDVVTCSELLEHVSDWESALSELIRISKKNIIITVPNEQKLVAVKCVKCGTENYLSGHINSFSENDFLRRINNEARVKIRKFHTIYTYNKLSLKLNKGLRLFLDRMAWKLSRLIPFLKPNYLLIVIQK